jgi:sugar-specific transcriptional regulator TrmB
MVDNQFSALMEFGLSEYEAKAYSALLGIMPATAYETAKAAGIPSSKIYEVLKKLSARQLVMETAEDASIASYSAQDPEVFLDLEVMKHKSLVKTLRNELPKLKTKSSPSLIWNLQSASDLLERAKLLVENCKSELLLSLWPREWDELKSGVEEAQQRGVKTAVVFFAAESPPGQTFFCHPIEDTIYQEKGGRGFAAIADRASAVMATIDARGGLTTGGYSANTGFVTLAEDYVKHDIYIMKIVRRFDKELIKTFGPGYRTLRDIWSDKEEK